MFWLPRLQNVFNVIPALACNGITQPYWETNFVYPINNPENPPATSTSKPPATTAPGTKTSDTPIPTNGACLPGSSGLGLGDGYNGYCCKTEQDCLDNCISGSCNGISNPVQTTTTKGSTTKTTTIRTATVTSTKTTTKTPTKTPTKTTTKTATKTTTKPATSCIAGVSGKKNGSGKTGYCCTSSNDCLAVCRSGTCNV